MYILTVLSEHPWLCKCHFEKLPESSVCPCSSWGFECHSLQAEPRLTASSPTTSTCRDSAPPRTPWHHRDPSWAQPLRDGAGCSQLCHLTHIFHYTNRLSTRAWFSSLRQHTGDPQPRSKMRVADTKRSSHQKRQAPEPFHVTSTTRGLQTKGPKGLWDPHLFVSMDWSS